MTLTTCNRKQAAGVLKKMKESIFLQKISVFGRVSTSQTSGNELSTWVRFLCLDLLFQIRSRFKFCFCLSRSWSAEPEISLKRTTSLKVFHNCLFFLRPFSCGHCSSPFFISVRKSLLWGEAKTLENTIMVILWALHWWNVFIVCFKITLNSNFKNNNVTCTSVIWKYVMMNLTCGLTCM